MDLVVHIGTEKTATTFLQDWLYLNRTALSDQGVYLSGYLERGNNRDLVAYFSPSIDEYSHTRGIKTLEDKQKYFEGFLERLAGEINGARQHHHTMILTSEHFHSRFNHIAEIESFQQYLRPLFENIRILCYIREQSELRRSLYSTALKVASSEPIAKFRANVEEGNHYFNYNIFLNKWARVFGDANIIVRKFGREFFFGGDIRNDFVRALGLKIDLSKIETATEAANESLTYLESRAFRKINEVVPHFHDVHGVDPLNLRLKKMIREMPGFPDAKIAGKGQRAFYDLFAPSNQKVSDQFFDGSLLFEPPREDGSLLANPTHSTAELGDLVETMVGAFAEDLRHKVLLGKDADVLRDAAVLLRDANLGAEISTQLMRIALRARPGGEMIKRKLREWTGESFD